MILGIYVYYLLLVSLHILLTIVHLLALRFSVHFTVFVSILLVLFVLLFIHIFGLITFLEILLIVVLLIDGLHVLLLLTTHHLVRAHVHAWMSLYGWHHARVHLLLHHVALSLLFQALGTQALMARRTERPGLPLTSELGRRQLAIVVTSKVAVRCFARQQLLAPFAFLEVADSALVALVVIR